MLRIAIDAMGGDNAPHEIVKGALAGARRHGVQLVLVGPLERVEAELAKNSTDGVEFTMMHSEDYIAMRERPIPAVKVKPRASIVVACQLVKDGVADAVVTMGHTGAAVVASLWTWGRIEGIKRAAVGMPFFTIQPETFLLDAGANIDCKAEYLLQFGLMGSLYAEKVMGIPNPTVGLLSNGEEENKGNRTVMEAFPLLKNSGLNFVGNVEGRHIAYGTVNVVVSDGFVGNVLVKLTEGLVRQFATVVTEQLETSLPPEIMNSVVQPVLRGFAHDNHYSRWGGMPLLGVNGICVIGHGRSRADAVVSAIGQAKSAVEIDLISAIAEGWKELTARKSLLNAL
ncbi:MAG: phosphate acyltransferase PlsX [Anaerolineae bacterium]